jgi:DNA-directed RNA polymerase subunit beta
MEIKELFLIFYLVLICHFSKWKTLDMVLNPLGVPSRMNVGQIFECLLGLAANTLKQNFKVLPFDEMHGAEVSRGFVYHYLYKSRLLTQQKWFLNQILQEKYCF